MPVCNNPRASNQLVEGTKYEVYPPAGNGDDLIITGWFVRIDHIDQGHPDYRKYHLKSTQLIFREDAPHQPGEEIDEENGVYQKVLIKMGGLEQQYRFCEIDDLVNAMENLHIAPHDNQDEEMNGGRRRKRGKKTRKPKRRARKTKRVSK